MSFSFQFRKQGPRKLESRRPFSVQPASANSLLVQPALEIGAVNDPLEREADSVADAVMRRRPSPVGVSAARREQISRACASCEAEAEADAEKDETLMAKAEGGGLAVGPSFGTRITSARQHGGAPLSPAVRATMEPRFQTDFSSVRVHTDPSSTALAEQINARAFTVGDNLFFGPGQYRPDTDDGQHLLAHELTHTIQQRGGSRQVKRWLNAGQPDHGLNLERPSGRTQWRRDRASSDPAERQADAIGERIGDDLRDIDARVSPGALPDPVRTVAESHVGISLAGTQLRADTGSEAFARRERAHAVAKGSTVSFGHGRLETETAAGRRLLGHELVHVAQQRAAGMASVQRYGEADDQSDAGPCEILTHLLTNQGLLTHLNTTRLFLHEHEPDDDGYYDWANLFRRLSAERSSRISGGHVWLEEKGLIAPPDLIYAIDGSDSAYLTVRITETSEVSGRPTESSETFVSANQFQAFLRRNRVPQHRIETLLANKDLAETSTQVELDPFPKTESYRPMYFPAFQAPGDRQDDPTFGFGGPLGAYLQHYAQDPSPYFGEGNNPFRPEYGPLQTVTYTPTSNQVVNDLEQYAGSYTQGGPERIYLPAGQSGSGSTEAYSSWDPADPLGLNRNFGEQDPTYYGAASSFGYAGQSRVNMPDNATGVMWQGTHASDFVVVDGRLLIGGFRSSLPRHGLSMMERKISSAGGRATASLNRGTPGKYQNDALFPFMLHAVAIYRLDGTPATAQEVASMMADARVEMAKKSYVFSTPPREHPAFERAFGNQGPEFCPPTAMNCISRPMDIHSAALGGEHIVLPQEDGTFIQLRDPAHASAANMKEWIKLPESFFTERGLARVPLTGNTWGGVGASAGLGGLTSLASDAYTGMTTDQAPNYFTNAAINTTVGGGSAIAENWAANSLASRFVGRGFSPTTSMAYGRVAGGAGVAVIAAPVATASMMYFDDQDYTNIDYAAKTGRSSVSALGGALAAGGYFALAGTAGAPGVGSAAGFVVGFGGYLVTDWIVGEDVEEKIRVSLGERGCVDGIGPRR